MSEHTPGPWLLDGPTIRSKHTSIATVLDVAWPYGKRPNSPEANARLIAAAPDLLQALREVSDVFGVDWREGSTQRRLGDLARAAIAKAEGKK